MGATASQAFIRSTSGLSCGPPHRPSMPAGGAGCEVADRLITDPRRPADVREGKSAVIDQAPDRPHADAQHPGCLGDGMQQRDYTGSARAQGERVDERLLHGAIPAADAYESRTSRLRTPRSDRSERRVRSIRCVRQGEVRRVRAYRRGSFASSESTDAACSTCTLVQPRPPHSDLSANCYMGAAGGWLPRQHSLVSKRTRNTRHTLRTLLSSPGRRFYRTTWFTVGLLGGSATVAGRGRGLTALLTRRDRVSPGNGGSNR